MNSLDEGSEGEDSAQAGAISEVDIAAFLELTAAPLRAYPVQILPTEGPATGPQAGHDLTGAHWGRELTGRGAGLQHAPSPGASRCCRLW